MEAANKSLKNPKFWTSKMWTDITENSLFGCGIGAMGGGESFKKVG